MLSAATRACLFAGPASEISASLPGHKVTDLHGIARRRRRPAAEVLHVLVRPRCCPSHAQLQSRLARKLAESGETPMASITMSELQRLAHCPDASGYLPACRSKPVTRRCRAASPTPCCSELGMYEGGHVRIQRAHQLLHLLHDASRCSPRCARFSAISRPMKPPPMTVAERG